MAFAGDGATCLELVLGSPVLEPLGASVGTADFLSVSRVLVVGARRQISGVCVAVGVAGMLVAPWGLWQPEEKAGRRCSNSSLALFSTILCCHRTDRTVISFSRLI